MQINKLEIENFKLFAKEEFNFHPEFNLVIGENGSGKTSLLRAVAVALGGWAYAYIKDEKNRRPILKNEIREIQIDNRFDKTKFTSVNAHGKALAVNSFETKTNVNAEWKRYREEGDKNTFFSGFIQFENRIGFSNWYNFNQDTLAQNILDFIEKGNSFELPLISFYECDRLWLAKNKLSLENSVRKRYSRFDPYIDCFHTGADHTEIGEWLLKYELVSRQQEKESPILQSIKQAAISALENCNDIRFDFEQSRVIVDFEENTSIPFEHLSDGQRTILGLFCDIARRAAILNPHLEGNASKETKGIVLIDELDLHLHPKWQRRIIEDLRQAFPKIQFICTTHSPFIVQSVKADEIINLDKAVLSEDPEKLSLEENALFMGVEDTKSDKFSRKGRIAEEYLNLALSLLAWRVK